MKCGKLRKDHNDEDHNFKAVEAEFDKNLKGFNIVKLKMNAKEAQDHLPQLDFAYIDGNHHYEYVKEDIQICLKKSRCKYCIYF